MKTKKTLNNILLITFYLMLFEQSELYNYCIWHRASDDPFSQEEGHRRVGWWIFGFIGEREIYHSNYQFNAI